MGAVRFAATKLRATTIDVNKTFPLSLNCFLLIVSSFCVLFHRLIVYGDYLKVFEQPSLFETAIFGKILRFFPLLSEMFMLQLFENFALFVFFVNFVVLIKFVYFFLGIHITIFVDTHIHRPLFSFLFIYMTLFNVFRLHFMRANSDASSQNVLTTSR